jgi:hypothetical protein
MGCSQPRLSVDAWLGAEVFEENDVMQSIIDQERGQV